MGEHAFYVYNTAKLNLVYMSKFIEPKIQWIEASADGLIYTALDNRKIVSWKKMHKQKEYVGHSQPIIKFILSSEFIFSLAEEGEFIIFNVKSGAVVQRKQFNEHFELMVHPMTYVNKLLFAGSGSHLELWNVINDERVYEFKEVVKEVED